MNGGRLPGLRERKRAAARARVEEIAVDLCLRYGYDAVTVGQICAAAEIAQSTFFNYFGSKDVAILGRPPLPTAQVVETFVDADGPLLSDLLTLLVRGARDAVGDLELFRRRFELIDNTPQLRAREIGRVGAGSWLTDAVGRRLRRDERLAAPEEIAERAHMAVTLALSLLRHTFWAAKTIPEAEWSDRLWRSLALAQSLLAGGSPVPGRAGSWSPRPGRGAGTARRRLG